MAGSGKTTFHGLEEIVRVTLSDLSVIEGDALPKLDFKKVNEWLNPLVKREKAELAAHVHQLFMDVVARKLTVDDVSVLTQKLVEGHQLDGMDAAFLVLVGMRVHALAQRKKGGQTSKKPEAAALVDEMQSSSLFNLSRNDLGEPWFRKDGILH